MDGPSRRDGVATWTWASASSIGTAHIRSGTRKQDAFRCYVPAAAPDFLICVVADGAGSAECGGEGASLTCRTISLAAQEYLQTHRQFPTDEDVFAWIDLLRDQISYAANKRGKKPRDFAATLICVVTDGRRTLVAQVGDGCAALSDASDGKWRVPLWPDHGEYASTTNFVTDEPEAKCRVHREASDLTAIAVLTDGLERMALELTSKVPFAGFFDGVVRPVKASSATGKNVALSAMLRSYLDSEKVCERTDDDKTLVVAAMK